MAILTTPHGTPQKYRKKVKFGVILTCVNQISRVVYYFFPKEIPKMAMVPKIFLFSQNSQIVIEFSLLLRPFGCQLIQPSFVEGGEGYARVKGGFLTYGGHVDAKSGAQHLQVSEVSE